LSSASCRSWNCRSLSAISAFRFCTRVFFSAGFFFNNANGGWEYPAFWIVALVVQALLGDGAAAVGTKR
jgi:hypothetical protein